MSININSQKLNMNEHKDLSISHNIVMCRLNDDFISWVQNFVEQILILKYFVLNPPQIRFQHSNTASLIVDQNEFDLSVILTKISKQIDERIIITSDIFQQSIDLIKIYTCIHQCLLKKQIYTVRSVFLIMTDLWTITKDIESLIDVFGSEMLHIAIQLFLDTSNHKSLVDNDTLNNLSVVLRTKNISIRTIFALSELTDIGTGDFSTPQVTKAYVNNVFKTNNLSTKWFDSLDPLKPINLVDEIFRPVESITQNIEYPVCVIIPSYNNMKMFKNTLSSVFDQHYQNYRIIYVDDCSESSVDMCEIDEVCKYIHERGQNSRSIAMKQTIRQRQGAGRYIGYHMAYDDEIIILLDGDDKLYDHNVLNTLSLFYDKKYIGATYGSFVDMLKGKTLTKIKGSEDFPDYVINNRSYRSYRFISAHLRTGFAKFFKHIVLNDLLYKDNKFLHIMTDVAEMFPIHEMLTRITNKTNDSFRTMYFEAIKRPLCIYNMDNSLAYTTSFARRNEDTNYYKQYRVEASKLIRSRPVYDPMIRTATIYPDEIDVKSCVCDNVYDSVYDTKKLVFIQVRGFDDVRYLKNIMMNYGLDILIVHDPLDTKYVQSMGSNIMNRFCNKDCLYLTGEIMNHAGKYIHIKALVCRDISTKEIEIIKQYYRCVIRKREHDASESLIIGYLWTQ